MINNLIYIMNRQYCSTSENTRFIDYVSWCVYICWWYVFVCSKWVSLHVWWM